MKKLSIDWNQAEAYPKPSGLKVFGTFVCGGGSTMGYKLAGFDHLGGVEIDKRLEILYRNNHNPKHFYLEDIREFNKRKDLPNELFNLDILDGSPPCTTFSMCGKREATWGKEKVFKEGQVMQTLDDLVFVYCDTIARLRPKTAILENVPGLVAGRAKGYAIEVYDRLESAGYDVQMFMLNSATMGVPQSRERLFFVARRRDLNYPQLRLQFNTTPTYFKDIVDTGSNTHKPLWPSIKVRWPFVEYGDESLKFADAKYRKKNTYNAFFSTSIIYDDIVPGALTSNGTTIYYDEVRNLNDLEYRRISGFPADYNFCGLNIRYICGMSVPPMMIAQIANQMRLQWFNCHLNDD
ncbi:MAG: DNA cytosine methyltransferase [Psychroserpens sp.]|uniref:DNA cytosine methyltransferase n=1 Tax=Psychroserpens sp. TaxID=2020870 RepID=UPI003C9A9681